MPNKATREDAKKARRRLEQTLKRLYPAEDLTLYPAGSEPLVIGGEAFPGLEERFGKLAELEGSRSLDFKRIYKTLSVYSHPNAAPIELLKRADSYYIDIPSLAEVITMGLRLHHMTLVRVASFFGWPFERVSVWEDNLAESFPGFFSGDPTETP